MVAQSPQPDFVWFSRLIDYITMPLKAYIAEINSHFQSERATEHTYRPALANLLTALLPELSPTNEPTRQQCGAPDYVLLRRRDKIPILIERKL